MINQPPLYFVTSNKNKLKEFQTLLDLPIENIEIELDEIQTTDLEVLLTKKVQIAYQAIQTPVIVEDTALFFNAWNSLPGPFIKWFLNEMGVESIVQSLSSFKDKSARAVCGLGYTDGNMTHLFEGVIHGQIVQPRGKLGFGWDPIFQPNGHTKTFGEMLQCQKNKFSMRFRAIEKFKNFLENHQEAD